MKKITNIEMFGISFLLSAISFGGGYITIPIIRKRYVEERALLTEEELQDIAAVAQSAPGAISVNLATAVGYRVNGWFGGFCSFLGTICPPLIIISIIAFFYNAFMNNSFLQAIFKGMEIGVAVIMALLVIDMVRVLYKRDRIPAIALLVTSIGLNLVFPTLPVIWILILNAAAVFTLAIYERRHV